MNTPIDDEVTQVMNFDADDFKSDAAEATASATATGAAANAAPNEDVLPSDDGNDGDGQSEVLDAEAAQAEPSQEAVVTELKGQLLRVAADFENFKKRSRREQDEMKKTVAGLVLKDLLPVLDNFARALEHADDSPLTEGVKMVSQQLLEVGKKHGLEPFASLESTFDPEHHEAFGQVPHATVAAGQVCQVVEEGYKLNGKLLRAAKVLVSKGPAEPKLN